MCNEPLTAGRLLLAAIGLSGLLAFLFGLIISMDGVVFIGIGVLLVSSLGLSFTEKS